MASYNLKKDCIDTINVKSIPIKVYYPQLPTEKLPAIIFFHSGGWVFGTVEHSDGLCRTLCNQTKHIIVSVEYRKAPEHPFPDPFDDCYSIVKWCLHEGDQIGIDSNKIGVCGSSAGGCMATAITLIMRDEEMNKKLKFQLLLFPCLTSNLDKKNYDECKDGGYLTYDGMKFFWSAYLKNPNDAKNPYACPLETKTLKNLPPTFIAMAENDPLKKEQITYAQRLEKDQNKITTKTYEGMIHNFIQFPKMMQLPQQKEIFHDLVQFIKML